MGQQLNKGEKQKRRKSYVARCKARALAAKAAAKKAK